MQPFNHVVLVHHVFLIGEWEHWSSSQQTLAGRKKCTAFTTTRLQVTHIHCLSFLGVDGGCLRVFASHVRDVEKEGASCFISCCITNISRKLRGDNEIETGTEIDVSYYLVIIIFIINNSISNCLGVKKRITVAEKN